MTHRACHPLHFLAFALLLASVSSQTVHAQSVVAAALTTPLNAATGVDPGTMLTWNSVDGATGYEVMIGTSAGASDVYDSGTVAGTSFPLYACAAIPPTMCAC